MPAALKRFLIRKHAVQAAQAEKPAGATLTLSLPVAIALGLVLFSAVGWAFYLGFMAGRGENPETHIKSVAGLIIKDDRATEMQPVPVGETPAPVDTAMPEAPPPAETAPASQTPAPAESTTSPAPYPFAKPQEHQLEAWDKAGSPEAKKPGAPRKVTAKALAKPAPADKKAASAKGEMYNFTFQAAAYKSSRDAEKLKNTLSKNGISARTSKNGKVWLVIASLRGTDANADALRQKLQGLKLGKPLLLSKKAVSAKPKKGSR